MLKILNKFQFQKTKILLRNSGSYDKINVINFLAFKHRRINVGSHVNKKTGRLTFLLNATVCVDSAG